ncbi:MAPEG family protein [Aliiglaciecola sp. CAU 1673]|uniref:MAPEG family protein n=1 Tax=Aliiglaciecola sp. CAU 1673 TaxID=3032595 RepID=UPI0023DC7FB6|nr:MAPEG family protein [Aliiglaciecola sp. CAU 1673]MDF2178140.1 MAPEG family protein [Aliiglaciecola sp. CAU 1673]
MITLLYAGLSVFLVLYLAFKVIRLRNVHQVAIGDGGHKDLQLAIRAHANLMEYLPLCLLLMFLVESSGLNGVLIHGLGGVLLLGRLIHAYSIPTRILKLRVVGMTMTFSVLLVAAIAAIGRALGLF